MYSLGVGLVYTPELDPLFRENNPDLSVLELEPETFWDKDERISDHPSYTPNAQAMARISALPQRKLVHSVGFPVGGSVCYGGNYVTPLVTVITTLGSAWVSEHLSFNVIRHGNAIESVGFLLSPRQTDAGVSTAVRRIRSLASQLPVPFAFETGVNYLQPRTDEMADGEFFGLIADGADCGILLDLHNLWVNERNGRQPVLDVVNSLPLDRVWEAHVAGGMMLGGYFLDSHSDGIPEQLLEITESLIPRLPNLGALIFEIMPSYVRQVGLDNIRKQLGQLNAIWQRRPAKCICVPRRKLLSGNRTDRSDDVIEWEQILGSLAIGHTPRDSKLDAFGLELDPGLQVLQTLISEFRDGRISRAMRFTMTLLLAQLGPALVHELLGDFHMKTFPDLFTSGEADRFAEYLRSRMSTLSHVPFLAEVLDFEHALIRAALYGKTTRIEWTIDPSELFSGLETGRIPSVVRSLPLTMDIVPEG